MHIFAATIMLMSHWGYVGGGGGGFRCSRLSCFHLISIIRGSVSFTLTQLHAKNSLNVQTFLLSTPGHHSALCQGRKRLNLEVTFDQPRGMLEPRTRFCVHSYMFI